MKSRLILLSVLSMAASSLYGSRMATEGFVIAKLTDATNEVVISMADRPTSNDLSRVAFTGYYADLLGLPDLNLKQDALTEPQTNAVNSGITEEKVSIYDGYSQIISGKAESNALARVAWSGKYDDLIDTPDISECVKSNDLGSAAWKDASLFATTGDLAQAISSIPPPDFTTNNLVLVQTISETSPPPDFTTNNTVLADTIATISATNESAVVSVNGQTGVVVLDAANVGAYTKEETDAVVSEAIAGIDMKPTRIYNKVGTDALDDKGQLFDSEVGGNYFYDGNRKSTYYYRNTEGSGDNLRYVYRGDGYYVTICYYPAGQHAGKLMAGSYPLCSCDAGKDPTVPGTNLNPDPSSGWTFTPYSSIFHDTPYAHIALEEVPTRTISANYSYAVGDLLGDDGKAYRCKEAYTSAASNPTAPHSDTTHWEEIPVLDQKVGTNEFIEATNDLALVIAQKASQSDVAEAIAPLADTNWVITTVSTAIAGVDTKPTRIYNARGTNGLDDKGQLFDGSLESGGHWEVDAKIGNNYYERLKFTLSSNTGSTTTWQRTPWVSPYLSIMYEKSSGDVRLVAGDRLTLSPTAPTGKDPTSTAQSAELAGLYTFGAESSYYYIRATYVPQAVQINSTPYAHFALESIPEREYTNEVYSVGDLVSYSNKAYRCTSAIASAEAWNPAHWTEIPVLAQKADYSEVQRPIVVMEYNEANAWSKFQAAISNNAVVLCKCPDGSNPPVNARMAILSYYNPKLDYVEFQYLRKITHNVKSQNDVLHIYKLTSSDVWNTSAQTTSMQVEAGAGLVRSQKSQNVVLSADYSGVVGPLFASTNTYSVGDVVIYNGVRYRCITDISEAGEWNSNFWTNETIQAVISTLASTNDVAEALAGYRPKSLWADGEGYIIGAC